MFAIVGYCSSFIFSENSAGIWSEGGVYQRLIAATNSPSKWTAFTKDSRQRQWS